jgi:hypothetical protein
MGKIPLKGTMFHKKRQNVFFSFHPSSLNDRNVEISFEKYKKLYGYPLWIPFPCGYPSLVDTLLFL